MKLEDKIIVSNIQEEFSKWVREIEKTYHIDLTNRYSNECFQIELDGELIGNCSI